MTLDILFFFQLYPYLALFRKDMHVIHKENEKETAVWPAP